MTRTPLNIPMRSESRPRARRSLGWSCGGARLTRYDARGTAQVLMACVVMILQVILTSYVFGTLFHMLLFRDNTLDLHKEKMERVKKFCTQREIPAQIYDELRDHFEFQVGPNGGRRRAGGAFCTGTPSPLSPICRNSKRRRYSKNFVFRHIYWEFFGY